MLIPSLTNNGTITTAPLYVEQHIVEEGDKGDIERCNGRLCIGMVGYVYVCVCIVSHLSNVAGCTSPVRLVSSTETTLYSWKGQ